MNDRESDPRPIDQDTSDERRRQAEEILSEHLTRQAATDTDLNALCAEHPGLDEMRFAVCPYSNMPCRVLHTAPTSG